MTFRYTRYFRCDFCGDEVQSASYPLGWWIVKKPDDDIKREASLDICAGCFDRLRWEVKG